ncbi:reverse transcriptase domain-containing protein [Tanacetum coccineum]
MVLIIYCEYLSEAMVDTMLSGTRKVIEVLDRKKDLVLDAKERNEVVNDIKRSLNKLHQMFLDMSVLVETQDRGLNDTEENLAKVGGFAKECMLAKAQASDASSKAKVQACGSKSKLQTSKSKAKLQRSPKTLIVKSHAPITNGVLGLVNAETWDAILSKTFGVKIPPTMACAEEKKGKRKISRGSRVYLFMNFEIIVLSSNSSYDKKGPSKASVPIFEGPSVQGLLDWYGYNTIEEYLSWNYFSSTDKDITDKDCIHVSNYAMSKGKYVPVSQKYNPKVKSDV